MKSSSVFDRLRLRNQRFNWQDTPVFICNRNRLDIGFRQLVEWLYTLGMGRITVLDNQSTYEPLLEFYEDCKTLFTVVKQPDNLGPYVMWKRGYYMTRDPFVYTDGDVVPNTSVPRDVIHRLHDVLSTVESDVKVGPSLRIDNLPDCFDKRDLVRVWEKQFWLKQRPDGNYIADIDTTFAMYRPCQPFGYKGVRLSPPYSFEHKPWYSDSANPTEEEKYYSRTCENYGGISGWGTAPKEQIEQQLRLRGIWTEQR